MLCSRDGPAAEPCPRLAFARGARRACGSGAAGGRRGGCGRSGQCDRVVRLRAPVFAGDCVRALAAARFGAVGAARFRRRRAVVRVRAGGRCARLDVGGGRLRGRRRRARGRAAAGRREAPGGVRAGRLLAGARPTGRGAHRQHDRHRRRGCHRPRDDPAAGAVRRAGARVDALRAAVPEPRGRLAPRTWTSCWSRATTWCCAHRSHRRPTA
jgi:hypothetical protein